jgi:hypothetical protein
MPNNLAVTLDESTTPWSVDVDQHDKANEVGRSPNAQTITWQLEGNAATGNIISFAWLSSPPPPGGTFGAFSIGGNGNQATMSDLNNSASTAGTWIYQLTIEVDDQEYSTIAALPIGTNTNPNIKNS